MYPSQIEDRKAEQNQEEQEHETQEDCKSIAGGRDDG